MTSKAMGMEAGLLVQYKLSGRVSVGSGLRVINLEAGRELNPSLTEGKHLESVNATISAVSIPINTTINVNKTFFTTVGITPVTVFQEKRTSTFLNNRKVVIIGSSGDLEEKIVSEVSSEKSLDGSLKNRSYLGFLDFSLGYNPELFKKMNVTVAPYVRIPVGPISAQDVKLFHGGISFRFTLR